jgi:hypothetical protein
MVPLAFEGAVRGVIKCGQILGVATLLGRHPPNADTCSRSPRRCFARCS